MTAPADAGSAAATPDWLARRERSNRLALRLMAFVAVHAGRPAARLLLLPITLYFLLFAPAARRHSVRFLTRALGRPPRWRERWAHLHAFASVVLDRVYFARGQLGRFALAVHGGPLVDATLAEGRGAFLLGAHVGSFEALHAIGREHSDDGSAAGAATAPRVAHVMYPDNARLIQGVLAAIAPGFELGVIPIGRPGSTLAIRDWLDGGGLAGLLGDRHLPHDETVLRPFLGVPARFPVGPLRLALLLQRRVLFMVGLYRGGNRYELRFEELADFRGVPRDPAAREAALDAALTAYVRRLEALAREAPANWFNFHDFWGEDAAR